MRVRFHSILLLGAFGAACSSAQTSSDASAPLADGGNGSADAAQASDAAEAGTPDSAPLDPQSEQALWNRIDAHACDATQFKSDSGAVAVADAAGYFLGSFKKGTDGKWTGREYWLLYATPDWQKSGGKDCRVVWNATVAEAAPATCSSCEKAATVTATLDKTETTCAADLYKGQETYTVTYEVDIAADGAAEFFFSKSKKSLGTGFFKSDATGYLSPSKCLYF